MAGEHKTAYLFKECSTAAEVRKYRAHDKQSRISPLYYAKESISLDFLPQLKRDTILQPQQVW